MYSVCVSGKISKRVRRQNDMWPKAFAVETIGIIEENECIWKHLLPIYKDRDKQCAERVDTNTPLSESLPKDLTSM